MDDNVQEIRCQMVDIMESALIRVEMFDGRMIEGTLTCIDRSMNLIMSTAIEYHGIKDIIGFENNNSNMKNIRELRTVMVPSESIKNIFAKEASAL